MSRTSVLHDRSRRSAPGASHRSHPAARHPLAGPPLLRAAALGRGRVGVAAGHQPAASPAGRPAGDRLPGAVPPADPDGTVRGAVGHRGTVGTATLQRCVVPGRQPPQGRSAGRRVPAAQARPGPGPVLLRHVPAGWASGAAAGRTRPACAVGAAGRPWPYPPEQVRAVTLLAEGGRLWLAVTAAVPI